LPVPLYSCFDSLVLRFFAVLLLLPWSSAALLCLKLAQVWVACCIVTGAEEKKKRVPSKPAAGYGAAVPVTKQGMPNFMELLNYEVRRAFSSP
jgi:hypothetical protein